MTISPATDGVVDDVAADVRDSPSARGEILTGAHAVQRCLRQLTSTCDIENMSMLPRLGRVRRRYGRGVTVRALIRPDAASAEAIAHLGAGEVRTSEQVTRLVVIVNRSAALLNVRRLGDRHPMAAHITDQATVATLVDAYEAAWATAEPTVSSADEGTAFTSRQLLILTMLTEGSTDDQIARRLELSSRSVRTEVAMIRERLQAHSRFQAGVRYAELRTQGLVHQEG